MPMYDYKCECGHQQDEYAPHAETANEQVVPCEKCGKEMTRVFPVTGKPVIH